MVKSSSEGAIEFSRTYGRPLVDTGESITCLESGDFIIGGGSGRQDTAFAIWDAYHLRVTTTGDTVWTNPLQFGNGLFDKTHQVLDTPDDGFYSVGKTANDGYQIRISRHNGEGELEWAGLYGFSFSSSNIHADAVDTLGRFAVAYTYIPGVLSVFMTDPDPALSFSSEKPLLPTTVDIQVLAYPNPFNASATLKIVAPLHVVADLSITNPLGQSVTTLFHGKTDTSPLLISFDGSRLSSGVYFARLQTGNSQTSTQLILLK
ncbi:MAG: T9SS type A sorting domain-containing protein [bacterium]|nr:T9SS type A sorting domain-containing protein [bacterium]